MMAAIAISGGLISRTAHAQVANCKDVPNKVFVSGSSALQPAILNAPTAGKSIAQILAEDPTNPVTVVYQKPGSCVGVGAMVSGTDLTGTAQFWDTSLATPALGTCNMQAGDKADVGASDVFPTSCANITQDLVNTAMLGDFSPFAQVMVFVVPGGSSATTISAEAAYLTFGVGPTGGTQWDDPTLHYVRNNGSGTETMIGKAIKVDAGKWWGINTTNGATGVAQAVSSGSGEQTIGIVSTAEAQDPTYNTAPAAMHMLAFQAFNQTCAYYPDSTVSALDKRMVRDGHYEIWGPLHLLAKVSGSGVASGTAKTFTDIMTGKTQLAGAATELIDLEIAKDEVPLCSMTVARTAELGPMMSVQPSCECYFEKKTTGTAPTGCKTCTTATQTTDCTGAGEKCNYGYCEVLP
jgi:hypothetical protein